MFQGLDIKRPFMARMLPEIFGGLSCYSDKSSSFNYLIIKYKNNHKIVSKT